MKTLLISIICLLLVIILVYIVIASRKKRTTHGEKEACDINTSDACDASSYQYCYSVQIDGMSCEHCKARVESAFNTQSGCFAEVDLSQKIAVVKCQQPLSEEDIARTVNELGFTYVNCCEK